jgi:hypothetical protein
MLQHSIAEITLIQRKARLGELRRLKEELEEKIKYAEFACSDLQASIVNEKRNEKEATKE